MNNILLTGTVSLFLVVSIWLQRKEYTQLYRVLLQKLSDTSWLERIFLAVFFLFILIKASGQVQSLDSGSYHLPFIKWVEAHKVITGLANIHTRFGFNYHYHILYAFLGMSGLMGTTLHGLNGYMFLMGTVYFFSMYKTAENNMLRISAIIAMLYISQINKGMTGFSPDFPVAIIQMMLVFESLKLLSDKQSGMEQTALWRQRMIYLFFLAFGAITLKLATVSVLFVILIAFLRYVFQPRHILQLSIMAVVAFFPYFLRNYLISGYLIYPFYSVDLFQVAWKVPMARTIDEKIVIKNYALGYPYYYKGVYHYNLDLFRTWWKNLSYLNKAYPPVIIAVAGALVGTLFSWSTELLKTGKATFNRPVNVISAGLVAGLLFWFYNAPDLRFGNGIILPFIALTVAGLADRFKPGKLITVAAGGTFVVICLSSVLSVSGLALSQTTLQTNNVEISLMMQPPYPQPDTATVMVDGQHTWRSETRCWECPLPCSYTVDSFRYIQPGNIEAGFTPKNEQNATGTQ